LEDWGVDGRIILKWALKKKSGRVWTGFFWLRIDTYSGDGNVYTTTTQHNTTQHTTHFLTSCRRDHFLKNPANRSRVVSIVMGIFVSYIHTYIHTEPPTTKTPQLYEPERLVFKKCVSS